MSLARGAWCIQRKNTRVTQSNRVARADRDGDEPHTVSMNKCWVHKCAVIVVGCVWLAATNSSHFTFELVNDDCLHFVSNEPFPRLYPAIGHAVGDHRFHQFPRIHHFFGLYLAIVANTDHTEVIDLGKVMPAIPL